jgi:hypothetical protein
MPHRHSRPWMMSPVKATEDSSHDLTHYLQLEPMTSSLKTCAGPRRAVTACTRGADSAMSDGGSRTTVRLSLRIVAGRWRRERGVAENARRQWLGRAGEEQRGSGGEAFARAGRGAVGDERVFTCGAYVWERVLCTCAGGCLLEIV